MSASMSKGSGAPAVSERIMPPGRKVVVLTLGRLRLMLPQHDIRAVESASDVDPLDPPGRGAGWITYVGQRWPVYCLSEELGLLTHVPAQRRACVLLALTDGYLGLECDDVRVLANFSGTGYDLPDAMRSLHSPLHGLVHYEDGLACYSDAARMAAFMTQAAAIQ